MQLQASMYSLSSSEQKAHFTIVFKDAICFLYNKQHLTDQMGDWMCLTLQSKGLLRIPVSRLKQIV